MMCSVLASSGNDDVARRWGARSAFAMLCGLIFVNGCAGPSKIVGSSASQIPLTWTTLDFTDAQPLAVMSATGSVELAYKIKSPRIEHTLYFGELQNSEMQSVPVVVRKDRGQFRALRMEKEWTFDQWQRLSAGPATGEIWGVVDQPEGNRGEDLMLAHSVDSGMTWKTTVIRKPCETAAFYDIVMSADGVGRLTLTLLEDCESNEHLKAGLYHYRTSDGGKSWRSPEYEADGTHPGDDVTEDEQPGSGQTALGISNRSHLAAR
jgi:hypothetical protein